MQQSVMGHQAPETYWSRLFLRLILLSMLESSPIIPFTKSRKLFCPPVRKSSQYRFADSSYRQEIEGKLLVWLRCG